MSAFAFLSNLTTRHRLAYHFVTTGMPILIGLAVVIPVVIGTLHQKLMPEVTVLVEGMSVGLGLGMIMALVSAATPDLIDRKNESDAGQNGKQS